MMAEISEELAEICGIHAGEGYMRLRKHGKGEVDISGHLEEKDYYDNHVIPLFNKECNLEIKGRSFSRGTYGFVSYQKIVRDKLLEMGFPSKKKSLIVRIPKNILDSDNELLFCRFLRGLFDTDGNLGFRKSYAGINKFKIKYNHYPRITITTVSRDLAEDLISILHKLDFLFNYHITDPKRTSDNRKHIISISGIDGLDKWMNLVGMKNSVKLSRYMIWKKFGFCPTNLSLVQREDILNGKLDPYSIGL